MNPTERRSLRRREPRTTEAAADVGIDPGEARSIFQSILEHVGISFSMNGVIENIAALEGMDIGWQDATVEPVSS